jgi:hypothetical protein
MTKLQALAVAVATSATVAFATPASAYPVDCAILLCLAGGWPTSAECSHARAVFIARITPWPVEPPLQIWNCPMRASLSREGSSMARLYEIAFRGAEGETQLSTSEVPLSPLLARDQADVDISGPAYDFVRSIHVYRTEFRQHRTNAGDCSRQSLFRSGTYGRQGDFSWSISGAEDLPTVSRFRPPNGCQDYVFRSVLVDWKDQQGNYGFEEVRY